MNERGKFQNKSSWTSPVAASVTGGWAAGKIMVVPNDAPT
jgi:hypothetical protein